jgi:hypothetical protein
MGSAAKSRVQGSGRARRQYRRAVNIRYKRKRDGNNERYNQEQFDSCSAATCSVTVVLANGRPFVMASIEFPLIRQDILAGRTSPMMIMSLNPCDLGENHQVLAYDYWARVGRIIDLWVYDPNKPDKDKDNVTISFNITAMALGKRTVEKSSGRPF